MGMLITTSRKPSSRTRSFARSLERVLNSKSINRGKMSIRDVILKAKALGHLKIAVISEMKGNPSRMDFYDSEGEIILSFAITVSNSIASGRIQKKKLHLRWELNKKTDIKDKIISLLEIPEDKADLFKKPDLQKEGEPKKNSNLLLVKKDEKGSKVVVEFFDRQGQITGPRIYIKNCRYGGVDGSTKGGYAI